MAEILSVQTLASTKNQPAGKISIARGHVSSESRACACILVACVCRRKLRLLAASLNSNSDDNHFWSKTKTTSRGDLMDMLALPSKSK